MAMNNQTLGRGEVYFSLLKADGVTPVGYRYIGNTPEFNLTIETENLDHFSSDRGIREKDKSVPLETTRQGTMVCDDIQMDNLALFFFGTKATVVQAAAAGQTYTITDAEPGLTYFIGQSEALPTGVKSVTVTGVTANAVAIDLTDDYTVDSDTGTITFVEGGAVVSGDEIVVSYSVAAKSYVQVISGTQPVEGAMWFKSYNPEGDLVDYSMRYVKLSPNGDFALKSDEWQQIPFNVEILKLADYEAIYIDGRPFTV